MGTVVVPLELVLAAETERILVLEVARDFVVLKSNVGRLLDGLLGLDNTVSGHRPEGGFSTFRTRVPFEGWSL